MTRRNQVERKGPLSALVVWASNAGALYLAAKIIPGVSYSEWYSVPVMAAILVLAAWIIEPILYLAALPITLATFGMFALVINGVVVLIAAALPHGFDFHGRVWGLFPAVLTSVLISVFRMIVRGLLVRLRRRPEPMA